MNTTPFPLPKKHSLPEQLLAFIANAKESMRSGQYLFFTAKPESLTPQNMSLASTYLTRIIIDAYLVNRSVDELRDALAYHHEEFTRALTVFDSEGMRNNMASTVNDAFRALSWVASNVTQPEQLYQAYRYDMSRSDAHTTEASLLALHSGFLLYFGSQENNDHLLPLDVERDMAALGWSWDKQCASVGLQYITPYMHPNNASSEYLYEEDDLILHGQKGRIIKARTLGQREMVKQSEENDMLFAIGPAGTGKTYTAVALAVRALKQKQVKRIILTRPAVEAGENLGFLPGDLKEKLDPYLQPLYDALLDMLPSEKLADYSEQGIIQIAPLAFMRGRTLDNAFVILDEAQNATESQIKMFLTRMGKSAKFIITGDVTQIDLPKNQPSGLLLAQKILPKTEGISFVTLDERDVIRHQLVKTIIKVFNKCKKVKK